MSDEDDGPKIIASKRSGLFEKDGHRVEVAIYRFEGENEWTLEVVDEYENSTIWNDPFETDEAAWQAFLDTVAEEGIESLIERRSIH
jgi:hypothetical protein